MKAPARKPFGSFAPGGLAPNGAPIGSAKASRVGLSKLPPGARFRCHDCEYIKNGVCQNPDSDLHNRKVEPEWCCDFFDRPDMEVIV